MESTTETVLVEREIEIAAQLEPQPGVVYRVEVIFGHTARGM